MWPKISILAIFLQSILHLGVSLRISRQQAFIESVYMNRENNNKDETINWGCDLPKETKISACKEMLESKGFAEPRYLFNDYYEKQDDKFKCEHNDLLMISDDYFGTKQSQDMIMCPTCLESSNQCLLNDSSQQKVEEFFFSKSPDAQQSVLMYTWFEKGGYFTIYAHFTGLKTPLTIKIENSPEQETEKPFSLWPSSFNSQSRITDYEKPDFVSETENKLPNLIPKQLEMVEVV